MMPRRVAAISAIQRDVAERSADAPAPVPVPRGGRRMTKTVIT